MAAFNLNIVVPDAEVTRLRDASRWMFGDATLTNAQAQERWRLHTIAALKTAVKRYERDLARAAAEAGLVDITPT